MGHSGPGPPSPASRDHASGEQALRERHCLTTGPWRLFKTAGESRSRGPQGPHVHNLRHTIHYAETHLHADDQARSNPSAGLPCPLGTAVWQPQQEVLLLRGRAAAAPSPVPSRAVLLQHLGQPASRGAPGVGSADLTQSAARLPALRRPPEPAPGWPEGSASGRSQG